MSKKRLIFTLLYNDGQFCLSRNFRLQSVGDTDWLEVNYGFAQVSREIDELVVLDVSRKSRLSDNFFSNLQRLTKGCFAPITAGGGIKEVEDVHRLLRSGADKVLLNSGLYAEFGLVESIAETYGAQCVVGGVDYKRITNDSFGIFSHSGAKLEFESRDTFGDFVSTLRVGEIYLQSIDRDGTGQGLDLDILDWLPAGLTQPLIISGGVGNSAHIAKGMNDSRISAVATANLLNFVGTGLLNARKTLVDSGLELPMWE